MTQLALTDWRPPQPSPKASEQGRQISRVASGIAQDVIAFCRERVGQEFVVSELTAYVLERSRRAPASADRILRQLRQQGHVSYRVVDRGVARYLVESVTTHPNQEE